MASSWSSSPDYAGFWQRAAAFLIDWLVVMVILVPLLIVVFGLRSVSLDPAEHSWDLFVPLAIGAAVVGFWRYCGATPGKLAVGIKIVDAATGGAPSTGRLVIRLACYLLSAAPLYLGFLWALVDRRNQAWHDKIAGTVVPFIDWLGRFDVKPWEPDDQPGHSLVVIRRDGTPVTGVRAFAMLTRCLPLLFAIWAPIALFASFTRQGDLTTRG